MLFGVRVYHGVDHLETQHAQLLVQCWISLNINMLVFLLMFFFIILVDLQVVCCAGLPFVAVERQSDLCHVSKPPYVVRNACPHFLAILGGANLMWLEMLVHTFSPYLAVLVHTFSPYLAVQGLQSDSFVSCWAMPLFQIHPPHQQTT